MTNPRFWRNRRVLVTGHTGFKGAWLCAWLNALGARVSGFALPPDTEPNLYTILQPELEHEHLGDIRVGKDVGRFAEAAKPEIVLHLAAQSLVRESYRAPIETYETNVIGTAHLLEALRPLDMVQAVVVVTTDKVYENDEQGRPFIEQDPLGGHDPYSASKACAEILTSSYRRSFFQDDGAARIATARSGNVIGGGDWAADRIVVDIVRAVGAKAPVLLRYPEAVRPWLHVLEPLSGYMIMAERLASSELETSALNFAPNPDHMKTVAEVVDAFTQAFNGQPGWRRDGADHPREATLLTLSADAAHKTLDWRPQLDFADTVDWTASWYAAHLAGEDMREVTRRQIAAYQERLIGSGGSNIRAPEYSAS